MWAGSDRMMELLIRGGASPDKQNEVKNAINSQIFIASNIIER